ncbi:hypothetical protein LHK_01793 [Laribacter hongkongensis HLHK9]|uniref:Uncharacterized protein n=2 Tax=Laribacter hongkongensis TaxID=168471 RepID=C1D8I7_LARHH|nr:hypothetical protein LHK_01793 [Laribacter hongkongensis HLHK9]
MCMTNKRVDQMFSEPRFRQLLTDADTNAKADWDRTFVDDLTDRFSHYGMGMYLSPLQRHHLERIAETH